mmetsp:Transcript_37984/g.112859  ORF Transcript_37984/g.112859 Transcript_37984/m.112859 type:complete len:290 (-) Transcript_37984:221-1090(-)
MPAARVAAEHAAGDGAHAGVASVGVARGWPHVAPPRHRARAPPRQARRRTRDDAARARRGRWRIQVCARVAHLPRGCAAAARGAIHADRLHVRARAARLFHAVRVLEPAGRDFALQGGRLAGRAPGAEGAARRRRRRPRGLAQPAQAGPFAASRRAASAAAGALRWLLPSGAQLTPQPGAVGRADVEDVQQRPAWVRLERQQRKPSAPVRRAGRGVGAGPPPAALPRTAEPEGPRRSVAADVTGFSAAQYFWISAMHGTAIHAVLSLSLSLSLSTNPTRTPRWTLPHRS